MPQWVESFFFCALQEIKKEQLTTLVRGMPPPKKPPKPKPKPKPKPRPKQDARRSAGESMSAFEREMQELKDRERELKQHQAEVDAFAFASSSSSLPDADTSTTRGWKKPSASPYAPPVSFSAIKEDAGGGAAAPRVPPKNRVVAPAGRDIVCLLLLCVRVFCSFVCVRLHNSSRHAHHWTGAMLP